MRRTLTVAAIVIVLLGILTAVYFLFFKKDSGLSVSNGNPFGQGGADVIDNGGPSNIGGTDAGTATAVTPHLTQITAKPVARGFIALDASTTPVVSTSTTTPPNTPVAPSFAVEVRYIDRESGNMYAYEAADGGSKRLTNHTAPGVEETSWLPDGSVAYLRFLTDDPDKSEHIDTYALPADGSNGFVLPRDLTDVIPRTATSIFTLMPGTAGSVGTIEKADGSGNSALFTSPLSAITMKKDGANFLAYTKPAASLPGYAFTVDGSSGAFSQILGPLAGLAALPSPSGKQILYSYVQNGVVTLAFYDTATHAATTLPIGTFADKCVWTPDGMSAYCAVPSTIPPGATLPDAWYQGTTAFTDKIWRVDFTARVATLVADLPQLTETPIDAVSLTLDENASTLVFMNKWDDTLWAYAF
jgi:hypothetical protein